MNKNWVGGIVLLLVAAIGGYAFWWFARPPVDTTVATVAVVAPVIAKVEKVDTPITGGKVRTYKPAAKTKLKLPPAVIADQQQQVTGATTVAPSERKVTVTSVIDARTGETTTYSKPEPYSWVPAFESRGEARFDYGYKAQRGQPIPMPVGRLSVVHDFVQVKGFHAGVNVALDTDGTAFAGVGIGYRW